MTDRVSIFSLYHWIWVIINYVFLIFYVALCCSILKEIYKIHTFHPLGMAEAKWQTTKPTKRGGWDSKRHIYCDNYKRCSDWIYLGWFKNKYHINYSVDIMRERGAHVSDNTNIVDFFINSACRKVL